MNRVVIAIKRPKHRHKELFDPSGEFKPKVQKKDKPYKRQEKHRQKFPD